MLGSNEALRRRLKLLIVWIDRCSAIPGLILTTAVCSALLTLNLTAYRGSESLNEWTTSHKAIVAVIVQVLAQVLGLIHVRTVCTLIRLSFTSSLTSSSFKISRLQFVHAASTPKMSWTLPWGSMSLVLVIVLGSFFPAALWAAALAPIPAERDVTQNLDIPTFEVDDVSQLWQGDSSTEQFGQWVDEIGGWFSFDPMKKKDFFQASASGSSLLKGEQNTHTKLDKTGYRYLDRSQGTGSVAGLQQFEGVNDPISFTYLESVLRSDVTCSYNTSSAFTVDPILTQAGLPTLYQSHGSFFDGQMSGLANYIAYTDQDVLAVGHFNSPATRSIGIELASRANETNDNWGFHQLNDVQCNVQFQPRIYCVVVDTHCWLITPTVLSDVDSPWPNYADAVIAKVEEQIGTIATSNSGCEGGCPFGKSIVNNIRQKQITFGNTSKEIVLKGVESYLGSLVDDILVDLLTTRMVSGAAQGTKKTTITIVIPAVVFGDFRFIIAITTINAVVTLVYLYSCIRNRAWKELPDFNVCDVTSVMSSALRGGIAFERATRDSSILKPGITLITKQTRIKIQQDDIPPYSTKVMPIYGHAYSSSQEKLDSGFSATTHEGVSEVWQEIPTTSFI